jgi:Tfp pilus assembly protein PilO
MNLPKNLINLLGLVVVLAVLVAGVVLVALPMWGNAQTTQAAANGVAQTNAVYDQQVQALSAASARMDEITTSLAELETEIAPIPQMDDAFEIIAAAAASTGVVIESITAGELEPWIPRAPVTEFSDPANPTAPEGEVQPDGAAELDAATVEEGEEAETTPDTSESPQQQIPVSITVTVKDAATATAFIDALGRGPRLIAPVNTTLDPGTEEGNLVVNVLVFIRSEV